MCKESHRSTKLMATQPLLATRPKEHERDSMVSLEKRSQKRAGPYHADVHKADWRLQTLLKAKPRTTETQTALTQELGIDCAHVRVA